MKIHFYLVFSGRKKYTYWDDGPIRVTKKKPSVGNHEVAVEMNMDIPDALFEKPILTFHATLPDISGSLQITAQIQQDIADIIQKQTGLTVEIKALEPTPGSVDQTDSNPE